MDKNKDFIRIDDVFKNMADAEESVKAGAWSDMRALLDNELPLETTATAGSKARVLRYALPALLVLLLGGGFYVWNSHQRPDMEANASFKTIKATTMAEHERPDHRTSGRSHKLSADTVGHLSVNAPTVNHQPSTIEKANDHASTLKNVVAPHSVATATAVGEKMNYHKGPKGAKTANTFARTRPQNQAQNLSLPVPGTSEESVASRQPVSKLATSEVSEKGFNTNPQSINQVAVQSDPITLQSSLSEIRQEHAFEQIKPNHQQLPDNEPALAGHLAEAHHLEKVGQINQQDVYQSVNGGLYKEQKDTFKQIELVQKSPDKSYTKDLKRPFVPELDTVAVYKIARLSFVPLSIAEIKQLPSTALAANVRPVQTGSSYLLAAASPEASNTQSPVDLVPLKEFRVSSHKMDGSIFSRWFQYANGGMSGLFDGTKDWYVALLFGGNMGLGSPNAYGMQAGASFLYALAERWTLALEMRYQSSNYANFRFFDNATTYEVTGEKTPLGTQFSGTEYKTQTNYQANSLSRISVPVLLNYNLGRVSIFAGPEFSYYFHLNNTHNETVQANAVSKLAYDNKNPFSDEYYSLNPSTDFKSRVALGYAFGLSYDFSRKVSVDLRFNQMLWDNSGKYQLDAVRKIYRQPAVELNFGFYLGRKDKVIYIMDRNR